MKKIINLIKKYWLFILLAAIAGFLLAWRLVLPRKKAISPPVEPPTNLTPSALKPLPQPQSRFAETLGEGPSYQILLSSSELAKIPKNLSVYQTKELSQEEIITHFSETISGLGFAGQPKKETRMDKQFLTWKKEGNYLDINLSSGQFSFSGQLPLVSPAPSQPLNAIEAQGLTQEKLTSWGLVSEKTKVNPVKGFGIAGLELVPLENLSQAVVFQVVFNPDFEGYPLLGLGPAKNLIEAKVDNQGILLSLFFNLHQVDKEAIDDYPAKSFDELSQELEQGKVEIVEVFTLEDQRRSIPFLNEIQKAQISNLKVAYYETTEAQEFYQPIFLLQGEITLKDGKTYQTTFLSPAISSSYFQ